MGLLYQYIGFSRALKLSRRLSFSSTVTDESERILILAISFSRGLRYHHVAGEQGSQMNAIKANRIVEAPRMVVTPNWYHR